MSLGVRNSPSNAAGDAVGFVGQQLETVFVQAQIGPRDSIGQDGEDGLFQGFLPIEGDAGKTALDI